MHLHFTSLHLTSSHHFSHAHTHAVTMATVAARARAMTRIQHPSLAVSRGHRATESRALRLQPALIAKRRKSEHTALCLWLPTTTANTRRFLAITDATHSCTASTHHACDYTFSLLLPPSLFSSPYQLFVHSSWRARTRTIRHAHACHRRSVEVRALSILTLLVFTLRVCSLARATGINTRNTSPR
jgi:hypothetical protein